MRLDSYLTEQGIYDSRTRAQQAISAGAVRVNGNIITKASFPVTEGDEVKADPDALRYVSRGGYKLEKAIRDFSLDFSGKTVLDVGAATGGFTDCALQHGAARVTAVDVGADQLHPSLQQHPDVFSIENTDIRSLEPAEARAPFHWIVIDASFISLRHILPVLPPLLETGGGVVALIKPQFEQQERKKFKGGIIRDPKVHREVLQQVQRYATENGFQAIAVTPTDGDSDKNQEFLILLKIEMTT